MASGMRIAGVTITHPERVLYPRQGLTKAGLAHYYAAIAEYALPHLSGRPLTLVRCPQGADQACFFQRHPDATLPEGVERIGLREPAGDSGTYLAIHDLPGLLGLVQLGALEIHPWGSSAQQPEQPDRMILDLDPGPQATWPDVIHGARWLHERLASAGLESFVRTSGGAGLHVVVPLTPGADWERVRAYARGLAEELEDEDPRRFTASAAKSERQGKVYVDYLRNGWGASSIGSYSPRARPQAPVATPLYWDELAELTSAASFTVSSLPERLDALGEDPWLDLFTTEQTLPPRLPPQATGTTASSLSPP